MVRFAHLLPRLRAQVDRDLRKRKLTIDLTTACVVRLLDTLYLRIGNSVYTSQHGSYGTTTLQKHHVKVDGANVELSYAGKSGKLQRQQLRDARIVRILDRLLQEPGPDLFQYLDDHESLHGLKSSDVNRYLRKHLGTEFTAKDFRTWGANVTVARALQRYDSEELHGPGAARVASQSAVKAAAEILGNTPAIARSSYIDPRMLAAFDRPDALKRARQKLARARSRKYQERDEQYALTLLVELGRAK